MIGSFEDSLIRFMGWRVAGFLLIGLAGFCLALPAGADQPAAKSECSTVPAQQDLDDADLRCAIRQLAHPLADVRNGAIKVLERLPADRLGELVCEYHQQEDYESKRCLRYAIEYVYFRRQMAGEVGFLGLQPRFAGEVPDPKTGQLVECIRVVHVLEGFAADKAGLRKGDFILGFDGQPISLLFKTPTPLFERQNALLRRQSRIVGEEEQKIGAFTAAVKKRSPGSSIKMRILRPGQTLDTQLTGQVSDPLEIIEGARLSIAPSGQFLVEYVDPSSKAFQFGLRGGDLLMEVNGQPLPPRIGRKKLEALLKRLILAELEKSVSVQVNVIRRQIHEFWVTLELAGRPMDMLNPLDRYLAQARFANWWQEQGGEFWLADGFPVRWRDSRISPRRMPDLFKPPVLP